MTEKYVCPDCRRVISKSRRRRHKTRCGKPAQITIGSIHKGRNNPRFR